MKSYCIEMDGLGCAHCAMRVEEGLRAAGAQVETSKRLRETVETLGFDVNDITEA